MGGLVMMRSTPAGKVCVNSSGVMDLASMGRRVSHPSMACRGSRRGCRMWGRESLCEVAVRASGSMSTHVYDATSWPDLRIDYSPVAMTSHNSTKWMGLRGKMYLGVSARASVGGGLEVRGGTVGGVRGDTAAGQAGRGLMWGAASGVSGCPLVSRVFGNNLIWAVVN